MSVVFNFINTRYLLLIPLFIFFLYFTSKKLTLSSYKKSFLLCLRSIIVILLIFSLSGLQVKKIVDKTTTIFAVDLSDSAKSAIKDAEAFIKGAMAFKGSHDQVGIVAFGSNAGVEASPSQEPVFTGFSSILNSNSTNIAEGLQLASTLIPEESKKRIVLISDGKENIADALSQAKLLASQNITVDVLPMTNQIEEEVQLTELNVPKYLSKNQQFTVQVTVDSLIDTKGVLKIYNGKNLVESQEVQIRKGQNRYAFSDLASDGGSRIYRAEIEAVVDTLLQNNVAYAYTYVEDIPHILLIEQENSGAEIKEILKNSELVIDVVNPFTIPQEADLLAQYDGIIMANISADDLTEKFLNNLENYVKHTGGGLIVSGGENAYALGNYFDTPLETILPVDMELKDKTKIPDMGIVLVTDRSGSMMEAPYGVSKLELAKEAAIRSTDVLNEFDKIAVIAFDDQPQVIVELQEVKGNLGAIQDKIAGISIGGGTSIIPALQKAYDILSDADTKVKHIILLTDGQAETSGYDDLISQMKLKGITLSTVAVGRYSDVVLLERLAREGGGRYYYTDEFSDLPKIFMKETMTASKTYIQNETFYPKLTRLSPIVEGIDTLPPLHGYIATSPKSRAEVIFSSEKDDPVLAVWRYGLGRTAAWTSDMHNQWSLDWLASSSGVEVFRNLVSWIIRKPMSDSVMVEGKVEGENIRLKASIPNMGSEAEIKVNVVAPDMTEHEIYLKASAPGEYTGLFPGNNIGAYILNFQVNQNGEEESIHTGINVPYSPEYDINKITQDTGLLNQIAHITGGRVLTQPEEVFKEIESTIYGERDIDDFLLILALLFILFDIAFRRIGVINNKVEEIIISVIQFFKNKKKKEKKVLIVKEKNKAPEKTSVPKVKKEKKKEDKKEKEEVKKIENTTSALLAQKRKRTSYKK
ncbi:MAG: VWA domain-containing protein [Epulopiscium sp.]|nr:VWA domain-containing protein [Candidatus Epulonipiscium sp.]HPT75902.1 VWA domain-containing protein [Defluviitaleaceae bacterium]